MPRDTMIRLLDRTRDRQGRVTRRAWLEFGALTALGTLGVGNGVGMRGGSPCSAAERAGELAAPATGDAARGRAKSVILVFANGGQSQLDMWDPKPAAPLDVRGAFDAISTAVPGVQFCEHMPRIAQVADRLTVVRSMSHEDLDHGSAAYLALTGHYHVRRTSNPAPSAVDFPTYGAVLRRLSSREKFIYDAVHLNGPVLVPTNLAPGQNGGFLGRAFEPLVVGDVRGAAGAIPGLAPREQWSSGRLRERLSLKQALDGAFSELDRASTARDLTGQFGQALAMLSSPATREAFRLEAEPPALRERYGLDRSGQAMLLARRLVEAGVPFINVIWNHSNRGQDLDPEDTDVFGWDTHNDIFTALRERLLPRFDRSFAALIEDLDQRGLLDSTLVVCMGEFGRAPRVALEPKFAGASPGRKHWASVYSIAMAGAGVPRGAVLGSSDRLGGEPITQRYGPWDVAATMFAALGLDPSGHFRDSQGRLFPVAAGQPMFGVS